MKTKAYRFYCTNCGYEESVRSLSDPFFKIKYLNNKMNKGFCPKCGKKTLKKENIQRDKISKIGF